MPDVEHAGHVGGRYDYAERLAVRIDLGTKGARPFPDRIPALFHAPGVVASLEGSGALAVIAEMESAALT